MISMYWPPTLNIYSIHKNCEILEQLDEITKLKIRWNNKSQMISTRPNVKHTFIIATAALTNFANWKKVERITCCCRLNFRQRGHTHARVIQTMERRTISRTGGGETRENNVNLLTWYVLLSMQMTFKMRTPHAGSAVSASHRQYNWSDQFPLTKDLLGVSCMEDYRNLNGDYDMRESVQIWIAWKGRRATCA